jgi:hypothetical protein
MPITTGLHKIDEEFNQSVESQSSITYGDIGDESLDMDVVYVQLHARSDFELRILKMRMDERHMQERKRSQMTKSLIYLRSLDKYLRSLGKPSQKSIMEKPSFVSPRSKMISVGRKLSRYDGFFLKATS